jgi:hypothetical protein
MMAPADDATSRDALQSRLSIALWLVDDVTSRTVTSGLRAEMVDRAPHARRAAVRNLSGHLCFTDLAAGSYGIDVSGADGRYLPAHLTIDTADLGPLAPVVEVRHQPSPT